MTGELIYIAFLTTGLFSLLFLTVAVEGPPGVMGSKGWIGDIGLRGPEGPTGETGIAGPPGRKGDIGNEGEIE